MLPKKFNFRHNDIFLLAVFYTIMHGGILLIPNAIFWDDWILYRTEPSVIADTFKQAGVILNWVSYLHITLLEIGPWIYKVLTFFLMFICGLLLNLILARAAILSKENRFLVVLLFLVFPFNMARVAIIDFGYTLCLFSFFSAWYLIERQRIIALALFFFSFNTNSLLVFYALPVLDIMHRNGHLKNSTSFIAFIFRYPDFLILPFLFYFVKVYFYNPTGFYANYNQHYSYGNIRYAVKTQLKDLVKFRVNPYLFFALLPIIYVCTKRWHSQKSLAYELKTLHLFFIGCLALFLAGFPYWIVNLVPTFNEWSSRHQLLFPLGTAVLVVAILQLFQNRIKTIIVATLIAACLSYGLATYYSFIQDWQKQSELLKFMTANTLKLKDANLVIFDDKTKSLNAIAREYRFYEWNGLLEQATGNEKHFGIQPNELLQYQRGDFDQYFQAHYKADDHARISSVAPILITINLKGSTSLFNLKLKEFEFSATPITVTTTRP
jgi:hypothetical protein